MSRQSTASKYARDLGRYMKTLRLELSMTQDALAQESGVSSDTVRRVETGQFSPSIDTIQGICLGLGLKPSTVFASFEGGELDVVLRLRDMLDGRPPHVERLALALVETLLAELDKKYDELGVKAFDGAPKPGVKPCS